MRSSSSLSSSESYEDFNNPSIIETEQKFQRFLKLLIDNKFKDYEIKYIAYDKLLAGKESVDSLVEELKSLGHINISKEAKKVGYDLNSLISSGKISKPRFEIESKLGLSLHGIYINNVHTKISSLSSICNGDYVEYNAIRFGH